MKMRMHTFYSHWSALRFGLICAAVFLTSLAHADIMISPTRAVLDVNNPRATLTLRNPSNVARAYRLSWTERRMDSAGQLVRLKEGENPRSAAGLVRFSPRRVVVEPGQLQTIRLDFRPSADLNPGEYRSHLVIGLEPQQSGTKMIDDVHEGMSVQLQALISFSLPVIVRHGAGSAQVAIVSVTPEQIAHEQSTLPALRVTMSRAGEFSTYGNLVVYQQLEANAPVTEIGRAGNVVIYDEASQGTHLVPLNEDVDLRAGSWIRLTYQGTEQQEGTVFAEQVFRIGD